MKRFGLLWLFLASGTGCCLATSATTSSANGTGGVTGTAGATVGSGTSSASGSASGSGGQTGTGGTTAGAGCGTLSTCPLPDGGSYCANETLDPANCGGCGHACIPGDSCNGATCTCDAGFLCDDDAGNVCTSLHGDSLNCGGCGHVCPALQSCDTAGECFCSGGTICVTDAGAVECIDVAKDDDNCGQCGLSCGIDYGVGSFCDAGGCACEVPLATGSPCADVTNGSLSCDCLSSGPCRQLSFAIDVYPFLAQQSGTFGCSASACHSGGTPQAFLAFLDDAGQMDAGMAYAELLGTGKGGGGFDIPFCDAGVPPFAPSTECACFSLVIPGDSSSLLIDLVTDEIPAECSHVLQAMPKTPSGGWLPLPACSQQLIRQWVETGAKP